MHLINPTTIFVFIAAVMMEAVVVAFHHRRRRHRHHPPPFEQQRQRWWYYDRVLQSNQQESIPSTMTILLLSEKVNDSHTTTASDKQQQQQQQQCSPYNHYNSRRRRVIRNGAAAAAATTTAFLVPPSSFASTSTSTTRKHAVALAAIKRTTTTTSEEDTNGDDSILLHDEGAAAPIADLPLRRLQLPNGGMGREYVILPLVLQGKGPYDFMVDSGLTTELITPHLLQDLQLGDSKEKKSSSLLSSRPHLVPGGETTKLALSAGASRAQSLLELRDVSLYCGEGRSVDDDDDDDDDGSSRSRGGRGEISVSSEQQHLLYPLSSSTSPLHAVVSDFPQEHIDPNHDPVEGMIGMEVLEQFDVDFDFPSGRLRLWKPHSVESIARKAGMVTIDALVINETRLIGFRVIPSSATATFQSNSSSGLVVAKQPFLGLVDSGASFSVINWAAAALLGLPPQNDKSYYERRPSVVGLGVDGHPQLLPTAVVGLSFCGNPIVVDTKSTKKSSSLLSSTSTARSALAFEAPPKEWKPWSEISVAIGDLPVFTQLLGDGRAPYLGPAGIIGLDVLSQRRLILETSASRQRRIYVSRDGAGDRS